MCRFLIVRSAEVFDPGPLFRAFAEMARLSRAPDGDRQADGWGAAWMAAPGLLNAHGTSAVPPERNSGPPSQCSLLSNPVADLHGGTPTGRPLRVVGGVGAVEKYESKSLRASRSWSPHETQMLGWKTVRSLRPIWQDGEALDAIPAGKIFLLHARSASFPDQKEVLEFNQPFVEGRRAFVFNGLLKGVAFPRPLEGRIGAQKIWSLLKPDAAAGPLEDALETAVREIETHTREISALNIGLVEDERIAVYAHGADVLPYYHLWISERDGRTIVCSEPLPGLPFRKLPSGVVHSL